MHVDGYRSTWLPPWPARRVSSGAPVSLLDLVAQDPVVSRSKLIAEPWDVGQADSYDVGRFPPGWREWNGLDRDTMRDFWRSHPVGLREFAHPVLRVIGHVRPGAAPPDGHGQPDHRPRRVHPARPGQLQRQAQRGQRPSYNRDGTDDNLSWNCGAEGPTADPARQGAARPPDPRHARHAAAVARQPR